MVTVVLVVVLDLVAALAVIATCLIHHQSSSSPLSEECCSCSCHHCGVVSSVEEAGQKAHLWHETRAISSCPPLDHVSPGSSLGVSICLLVMTWFHEGHVPRYRSLLSLLVLLLIQLGVVPLSLVVVWDAIDSVVTTRWV